jgi:hypothetical protein
MKRIRDKWGNAWVTKRLWKLFKWDAVSSGYAKYLGDKTISSGNFTVALANINILHTCLVSVWIEEENENSLEKIILLLFWGKTCA